MVAGYVTNGNDATIAITFEFVQTTQATGTPTVVLALAENYNLQRNITTSGSLNPNYFGTGSLQSNKGRITFSEENVTGALYGKVE